MFPQSPANCPFQQYLTLPLKFNAPEAQHSALGLLFCKHLTHSSQSRASGTHDQSSLLFVSCYATYCLQSLSPLFYLFIFLSKKYRGLASS